MFDCSTPAGATTPTRGVSSLPPEARAALAWLAAQSNGPPLPRACRVVLHFHPDRPFGDDPQGTVLSAIAASGEYRSQFETGISAGSVSASPGGARWQWESRLFNGAYDGAAPARRPRYGALLSPDGDRSVASSPMPAGPPHGSAPRFGSSYLRLREDTLTRTTFCFPDSVYEPTAFGTCAHMALFEALDRAPPDDPLDRYIEAHVHGGVRIASDVEAVVLDPSFRGTETEAIAARLGCAVEWHAGYRASAECLREQAGYRGETIAHFASSLAAAAGGFLTPAALGAALRTAPVDPVTAKRVWHLLARFGRVEAARSAPPKSDHAAATTNEESPR